MVTHLWVPRFVLHVYAIQRNSKHVQAQYVKSSLMLWSRPKQSPSEHPWSQTTSLTQPPTTVLGGQILAPVTHMAPSRPTAKSCCYRLPQRAEDSVWGLLGWRLCPIRATEETSSHCRKPQVAMAHLLSSCHLANPLAHKGLPRRVCLGPTCKAGEDCIISFPSLSGTSRTFLLPMNHASLLFIRRVLEAQWIIFLSQILCWSFSLEIINLLFTLNLFVV